MKLRSQITDSALLLLRICTKVSYAGPVLNGTKVKNELMHLLWFGWRHLVARKYLSGPTGCSLDNWDFSASLQCRFWQINEDDWRRKSLICFPTVKCASLRWKSACICFSKNVCLHGGSAWVAGLWQAERTCPVWQLSETARALSCRRVWCRNFKSLFRWCVRAGAVKTTCLMWKHCWIW